MVSMGEGDATRCAAKGDETRSFFAALVDVPDMALIEVSVIVASCCCWTCCS